MGELKREARGAGKSKIDAKTHEEEHTQAKTHKLIMPPCTRVLQRDRQIHAHPYTDKDDHMRQEKKASRWTERNRTEDAKSGLM